MRTISNAVLDLHCAQQRLRRLGDLGPKSRQVVVAASQLARSTARLEAGAATASIGEMDPLVALTIVLDVAIRTGADWQQVVATVNRAGMARS